MSRRRKMRVKIKVKTASITKKSYVRQKKLTYKRLGITAPKRLKD
jgi:hypothetical protein